MKVKFGFILKVTAVHVVTYMICGIIFSMLFHYNDSLSSAGMRDMNDTIVRLAPVFQIVRGLLFGIVLWMIRDCFAAKKMGWLTLWLVIIILSIFNTPGTSSFSIEELIYKKPELISWNINIGGLLEIFTQTFLFSFFSWLFTRKSHKV